MFISFEFHIVGGLPNAGHPDPPLVVLAYKAAAYPL